MTVGCNDSRSIPKVHEAGKVQDGPSGRYQVFPRNNGVKVTADGYCGRWMTELIRLLRGHHEPQEERAFHEILRQIEPGATMVELGSNWAYYSLWFLRALGRGRSVLVEPDPNNLEIGRRNFQLNDAQGEFHAYSIGRHSTAPRPFACESDQQTRLVRQISVDELLARLEVPRVELLLADIQGAELDMLEGASGAIASRPNPVPAPGQHTTTRFPAACSRTRSVSSSFGTTAATSWPSTTSSSRTVATD